ncbi:MAG: transposase [Porphyromonadaceae bacterium]|nr:transposase [uncultured Macellibacteroides sp.]MCE5226022.1 transposase [Porphyromonadaceae bacterium]
MEEQYRLFLSDFYEWDQREHADKWVLFPENIGSHLSLDETALTYDELYTILTNKQAKGKKGSIVAIVKGTMASDVLDVLNRINHSKRLKVKEVTIDMAANMEMIVRRAFPKATLVTDRFHVQKLATEALQDIRVVHRWEAIEQESKEMELAKEAGRKYSPEILKNGETRKQLLARSRYLLFKTENKWTPNQRARAEVLFHWYPSLERSYNLTMQLRHIYHTVKEKVVAFTRLAHWYEQIEQAGFKQFNTVKRSISAHYQTIINYFDNRSTNASAESFNAKIKSFRACLRGVKNISYFLFRLTNIYA